MSPRPTGAAILIAFSLSACGGTRTETAAVAPPPQAPAVSVAPGPSIAGPVLGPDGRCTGDAPGAATSIEVGIGECDLLRLKGRAPTDVLVGESGKGQREVQVLYAEPRGRELYLFVNNRLDRIVR